MSTTYAGNTVAITSSTNATPIVVTATAHGRANGDVVNVAGHLTNTAANGQWVVASAAANTFALTSSVGNGVGGATGTVSAYVGSVTLQSDGDTDNATSRNPAPQGLADRLAMLKADYDQRLLGIFPIVPTKSVTRVVRGTPFAPAANWIAIATLIGSEIFQSVAAGTGLYIPVSLPQGAIWTGATAYISGAASPATKIQVGGYTITPTTGAIATVLGVGTDGAPSITRHALSTAAGTAVVDNTLNQYLLQVFAEQGAGAGTSFYWGATITYTLNATDASA